MPVYIVEKLAEIREHAQRLLEDVEEPEEVRNQHYFWILNAARSIELKLDGIRDVLAAFAEIGEAIQSEGEPVFTVRQIERIIGKYKKERKMV
jgi:hypothetical protein